VRTRLAALVAMAVAVMGNGAAACSGSGSAPAAETVPAPVATGAPTTTTAVPDGDGRVVDVYTPVVGDCFDLRTRTDDRGHETTYHLLVDCALPHGHEVFALVEAAEETQGGGSHPGAEALRRLARLECPPLFGDYVGTRYELSRYGLDYELPTAEQWATTHVVGCTLTGPDGGLSTGSARATRQ
jgi:hypothetical protein